MDKYIFELIDIVQKGNKDKVINLLIIFQNQIKSYSKKAHSEDIEQDLYVFLIHLIYTISLDKMRSIDDKTLMSYISRSIKFYFYKCFKKQYILLIVLVRFLLYKLINIVPILIEILK